MQAVERRIGDIGLIKGGACLVAQPRRRGRQHRSRTGQQRRWSRCLTREEGERNNKYKANIALQSITWQNDVPGVA